VTDGTRLWLDYHKQIQDAVDALGDGNRVTWRDATVADHEERIGMLTKMMAGTSVTAAMHISAAQMIKDAGVDTLGEVMA
jgi:hypothetical protein